MSYIPTENDLRLLLQRNKIWSIRVEVLNERFQILAAIQGEALSGSLTISADSDMRRTFVLDMYVKSSTYQISEESYFWLNKMIRPYYGVYDAANDTYAYYLLGTFLLDNNSYSYSPTEKRLSLSLVDLMATATSVRGSAQGAKKTVIEVNSNIRNAMISVVTQFMGRDRYRIAEFPSGQLEVPYDLEFGIGAYPYEILTELRDLYPCREVYFDTDGTFVCDMIPSGVDSPVSLDRNYIDRLLISEQRSIGFDKVKNVTEIWGQQLEADRTSETCKTVARRYEVSIEGITTLDANVSYCFTPDTDCQAGMMLKINTLDAKPIVVRYDLANGSTKDEAVKAGTMLAGRPYVVYYTENKFLLYGELDIHAMAMAVNTEPTPEQKQEYQERYACNDIRYVVNPEDDFAVERIGFIKQVFTGDMYDKIYTTQLALERAAYENWKTTRLQDKITLSVIAIPWIDVNQIIEFTSPSTGEVMRAMISTVNWDLSSGSMTIDLTRYYPYYPW